MVLEIITQFVLTISAGGALFMLVRKIPVLVSLPEIAVENSFVSGFFARFARSRAKQNINFYNSKELKDKTGRIFASSKKQEIEQNCDYWNEIQEK